MTFALPQIQLCHIKVIALAMAMRCCISTSVEEKIIYYTADNGNISYINLALYAVFSDYSACLYLIVQLVCCLLLMYLHKNFQYLIFQQLSASHLPKEPTIVTRK